MSEAIEGVDFAAIFEPYAEEVTKIMRQAQDGGIGEQLGRAVGKLIDEEGDAMLRVVSALDVWEWGCDIPSRYRFALNWLFEEDK